MSSTCGAENEANFLFDALMDGVDFTLPDIDFNDPIYSLPGGIANPIYDPIVKLTNADLTTRVVGGDGTFDWLMSSTNAHLKDEYDKGRITGGEYTKAYVALTQAAMASAVQYLLQRDAAFWAAANAQIAAITAQVQLMTAQANYMVQKAQALTNQAQYALTKLKLSTESITYCTAQYNLDEMMPQQKANLIKQGTLLAEQVEVQRAQTTDSRSDGPGILGLVGKQKDLIAQQIQSYQRDAEIKAGKLFSDGFSVQKTIDEGLVPPAALNSPTINEVLQSIKTKNSL